MFSVSHSAFIFVKYEYFDFYASKTGILCLYGMRKNKDYNKKFYKENDYASI